MGAVYLGRDPGLNRDVALKVLPLLANSPPEVLSRFRAEAQAVAALRHPNIVTIYELGETEGVPYIAMECLPGTSLAEAIRQRQFFSLADKFRMIGDVCVALQHSHERGIIHRDVKPANIWIEPDGVVKLLDFGIAKQGDSLRTTTGQVLGTPAYLAPEVLGGAVADARSDIFAVGVTLYEWLAFKRPFGGEGLQLFWNIQHETFTPIEKVCPSAGPEASKVVEKALSKNPDDRYATASAMKAALDHAAAHRALPLQADVTVLLAAETVASLPRSRHRTHLAVALLFAAFVTALIVRQYATREAPAAGIQTARTPEQAALRTDAPKGDPPKADAGASRPLTQSKVQPRGTEPLQINEPSATATTSVPPVDEQIAESAEEPDDEIVAPIGTALFASLLDNLSSDRVRGGDSFRAVLDESVQSKSGEVAPRGSVAVGRVFAVGRRSGQPFIELALTELVRDGASIPIRTSVYRVVAPATSGPSWSTIIIGAAAGASLGGLTSGKQGAAAGAVSGAMNARAPDTSTAVVSGARMTFKLAEPLSRSRLR